MATRVTTSKLFQMKNDKEKIAALTAYDYPFARMVDAAGVHLILVGDSLGMAVQGKKDTLSVTMEAMLYHTKMVADAAERAMVVGDMPFMSYQVDCGQAVANAGRFVQEAGAAAVKLEGGAFVCDRIAAIVNAGIPVLAHIGLTPQSVHQMGGFKVQRNAEKLMADARKVEDAGAFGVVLEGIPASISKSITESATIPTIGIGAGPHCDGQILVLHDLLGLSDLRVPKFVKQYRQMAGEARDGIREYVQEVQKEKFPGEENAYR